MFAVDLRGHGGSAWAAPGGYRVVDMADDVLAFADILVGDRPVLVGHPLGAAVAVHAGVAAPARFSHLALVDYLPECPTRS